MAVGRSIATTVAVITGFCSLSGCSVPDARDDKAKIVHSLIALLTSDGQPVCLNDVTTGEPLTIFRNMMNAPFAEQRRLLWYQPGPFRPANRVTSRDIFSDQMASERVILRDPKTSQTPLPAILQSQLTFAARRLSIYQDNSRVWLSSQRDIPLGHPRWWIINQMTQSCDPAYSVSNLIIAKNLAFLSVTAGHWGTTYAFQKDRLDWRPVAQWTSWLY